LRRRGSVVEWKTMAQKIFNKLGYDIYRIGSKQEYTICPPYKDYYTYSPWFEDWFQRIYGKFRDHTLLEEHRCYIIYQLCRYCLHLDGDFAECGVYKGGSAFLIADTLMKNSVYDKQIHLFDTFTGMPAITKQDPASNAVWEGRFGDNSLMTVRDYLREFPSPVFHAGIIPETLQAAEDRRFAFVHIDVDLYQTHLDCCNFFYDRMVRGGIVIFDDYGRNFFKTSVRKAVDEFFRDKPEKPIALHTGQSFVIKV
jgi:O-methyltransferase